MSRILVGVDGSDHATRALEWAFGEARLRDLPVVVVHAYRSPPTRSPYTRSYSDLPASFNVTLREQEHRWRESYEREVREHAEAVADGALEAAGGSPVDLRVATKVVQREPADALVEMSERSGLLVLGSRGLGGFRGLLLGSVSQQCLHHARCPVLIVR